MDINQIWARIQQMTDGANRAAREAVEASRRLGAAHDELRRSHAAHAAAIQRMGGMLEGMKVRGSKGGGTLLGTPDMLAIEDIPGRRIPFDIPIQIAVPANLQTGVSGSFTISQDGPFVAVARYATFVSLYGFEVTDGQNVQRFEGRSWGRQRPISSVLDFMDAMNGWDWSWNLGNEGCVPPQTTPLGAVPHRATNQSPFRTMEWDGWISLKGAVYPRQSDKVPSSLWAPGMEQMLTLPVLDYWEKGETIELELEPMHINNPIAGNIQAIVGSMPYLAGQYDGHEGIGYSQWECDEGVQDTIIRKPDGVVIVGLLGFRILQPAGVRMI